MRLRTVVAAALAGGALAAVYLRWMRPWQTHWGATPDEVERTLPGDDLVTDATWNATRAVTVAARPDEIWPFLIQIGWGRAGWYGYDWVDNGGVPSTWEVLPDEQHLEVGKDFPMSPWTAMYCVAFEKERWMLWRSRPDDLAATGGSLEAGPGAQSLVGSTGTWLWYLDPIDEGHTRLITRLRDQYGWTSPMIVVQLVTELGDLPFMRKCLLGVKARAEAYALRRGERV